MTSQKNNKQIISKIRESDNRLRNYPSHRLLPVREMDHQGNSKKEK
jgi:hypothetical protein